MTFYRRRLPHLYDIGQPVFLTWRLHGSLPANRIFPGDLLRAIVLADIGGHRAKPDKKLR